MLSLAIRASRHATSCQSAQLYNHLTRRAASTTTTTTSGPIPTSTLTPSSPSSTAAAEQLKNFENRVAFIRTWKPLRNIADAYTMIDAMERKYGKVLSVRFLKDFEEPTKFQMISFMVFEEPIAHRIPEDGVEFTIPSSGVAKEQHEITMEDLENILDESPGYDPDYQFPVIAMEGSERTDNIIGGRVRRGTLDFIADNHRNLFQQTPRNVMQAFLRWGGFNELKPFDKPRTIHGVDLFPGNGIDNVRMRAALQQSAMVLDLPNPNNVRPKPQAADKNAASTSGSSLAALAFGGLQEDTAAEPKAKAKAQTSAAAPASDASTKTTTTVASKPSSSSPSPSPEPSTESADSTPSTTPSRQPLTAEQLAAKEALRKQLDFAKQLKQTLATPYTGRKQAKPSLKPKRKQSVVPETPEFYEPDYIPETPEPEPEKPGVLKRLWSGLFGSKQ
ncbi:hypothetical protein D9613_000860 [Agrocybe pediades]|uniref:Uncharacterized protein n=1 Tax=Agrocybe pediades TaxID=84607 RepID=A0A8H4VT06_9AGAR|nr:hypothetical protein D9613_000860 [Agrocybe pediades]